ncbi:MAG TPA: methyltransferase domain-containing protein [Candidatus Acidoferrales bacterium]|nr:methyltransferase domain-containing protein [Candidatus Acidoferrales bacterium]
MKSAKMFFDEFSKQYEAQSRNKYLIYRWTADNVVKQVNKPKSVILDLGTGNGEIAIRAALKFPDSRVIGIDVSSGMIKEAEKKVTKIGLKNVRFVVSPMENLKIERADFVVSHLAFHHVKNKLSVVTEVYKILPRKGRVIIGDWFKPTIEYEREIEKLRAKNPTLSKKFDESWQDFISEPSMKEYQEKHSKEYPISQIELKGIIKKAGFRKQKIIKMPIATFAVVVGEK